jgi:hypothetical protein
MDNGAPYIGVLVAYTPRVASLVGDINGLINVAIGETNRSFRNSQVGGSVYVTGTTQVSYNEVGSNYDQHVARLQGTTDGYMDEIHALRNSTLADIVVLLVDDTTAGGQSAQIGASAATAFSVVYWKKATGYYSFAHELGHLFGGRHQRSSDPTSTPYVYGHGYVEPNKNWVTIMALPQEGCGWLCPRLQYWSNPNVIEATMNEPMGTTTYEDMARVLNSTLGTARDWRTIQAPTNVSVINRNTAGAQPVLQWTKTVGAESHSVYSCVFTGTMPSESCFTQRYGVYADQGSTMTFTDVYGAGVIDTYPPDPYHPCPVRQVAYRVRAYSKAGLSPNSYQVSVCVK